MDTDQFTTERIACAQRLMAQGHWAQAQTLLQQTCQEMAAQHARPLQMVPVWLELARAALGREDEDTATATTALQQAAQAFEQAVDPEMPFLLPQMNLDYTEAAARVLCMLGTVYLDAGQEEQAVLVAEKLLTLNKRLKKRYPTKVDILLTVAETWLATGRSSDAAAVGKQAARYFHQQLTPYLSWPTFAAQSQQAHRLQQRLEALQQGLATAAVARTVKFELVAATPADLRAVVAAMQQACGDRLKVSPTIREVPLPAGRRGGRGGHRVAVSLRLELAQ